MTMLPGGAANKLGNRYEKWWTVTEFVRMLHGATDAVRIEAPGAEKAEFVVTIGTRRELHQVKRSHPTGKWSLASLRADGLLRAIGEQLTGNEDRFVFASASDARELGDLCEAADAAESTEEFRRSFLAAKNRKDRFERLLACWKCDVPTALDILQRIEVRTIGEHDLQEKARWGVQALFLADPEKTLAEILCLVEKYVHLTTTRQALRDALASRGYQIRLVKPERAGVAVENVTDRYLEGTRRRLIQHRLVPRSAADMLLSRLDGAETDSVMTGSAGAGKTACVVEVVDCLRTREVPVLAFRLDRFLSAATTAELGRQLELEESPVLILAAAAEAAGRPGVLIVDQLDAVSTMSGRSSGAFDLIEGLLHEARGARMRAAIHTVVVCRAFDWKNDSRLRRLMPEAAAQVDVAEFPVEEVKTILAKAGFDAALFRNRQLELLRLPQNLSLLLEADFGTACTPTFGTATQLFDRYWKVKRQSVAETVSDHWMQVMRTLCDRMTATQQLSASRECLDDVPPVYLDQLTSEGVLTFDDHRYGFGHESFFDYCFARVFCSRSDSLVSFLKRSDQHLFRRAQVRQVLAYLRDANSTRYATELDALLTDDGIRAHLKDLVFALLAEVNDPTEEEWAIGERWTAPALKAVEEGTTNSDRLSVIASQRIFGSRSWFAEIDRRGLIAKWLAADNSRLTDMAVSYLTAHQFRSPDRVAALLEPYADRGGEWTQRLRALVERALITSRRFFDLLLRLVDNGTLDDVSRSIVVNRTFWSMLYDLGEKRPEWVPEVTAHRLRRRHEVIRAAGKELDMLGNSLIGYDDSAARMIAKSAAEAPAEFVNHVLPAVLDISDSTLTDGEPPKRDTVWPMLIETEHPSGEVACLEGLARALATLAQEGSVSMKHVIAGLRRRNTHVANHLLLALYHGAAARYANEAVLLLCADPWRFECGFSDSPNWCAMQLIRAVVPHCTAGNRGKLETVILRYLHPFERTITGIRLKQIGLTRFNLLSAIPADLRSFRANTHYEELKRKFGEPAGKPRGIIVDHALSPIEKSAADKMTDAQWLRAIDKHRGDRNYTLADPFLGDALELARVLETRVKEQPDRFARLGLKFPAAANPVYLEHTLAGLKTAAVGSDLKLQVCRKAYAESPGPCGAAIAELLGSIEDPLPDDAVEMLHWIATEHEDPAREAWRTDAGEIHTNGINTTRGRAADTVRDLILTDPAYIQRFEPTIERMIRDRSAAVLSCVAGTLRAVAYHDRTLGLRLFGNMNLAEDRLLATHHVCEFIRSRLRDSFPALQPIVARMLRSSAPEVREAGARMASLAALKHERAAELVAEALRGDSRQRLGVAQVAAANVGVPECRAWCEAKLTVLFDDCVAKVRKEAASCFGSVGSQSLDSYGELITAFCDSSEFAVGAFWLLSALEDSRELLPGMTCMVCERILDRFSAARDIGTDRYANAPTVAKLIFRTYQQHQNDGWTSRSLDLIDRICLEGLPGAADEFEQFDR